MKPIQNRNMGIFQVGNFLQFNTRPYQITQVWSCPIQHYGGCVIPPAICEGIRFALDDDSRWCGVTQEFQVVATIKDDECDTCIMTNTPTSGET